MNYMLDLSLINKTARIGISKCMFSVVLLWTELLTLREVVLFGIIWYRQRLSGECTMSKANMARILCCDSWLVWDMTKTLNGIGLIDINARPGSTNSITLTELGAYIVSDFQVSCIHCNDVCINALENFELVEYNWTTLTDEIDYSVPRVLNFSLPLLWTGEFTLREVALFGLVWHYQYEEGCCKLPKSVLSTHLSCSDITVLRMVKTLKRNGLICVDRRPGLTNSISLTELGNYIALASKFEFII